jgi:CheY-like chemotaxis protein
LEDKPISGAGKILIVDDEEPIVQSSQAILSSLGYSVTGTTSSREALEKIEKQPNFFDLVLTDMTMPEMDGLTLSRRIKSINPEIPIVLCTGFSHGLTKEMCHSIGIFDMIMKPMITGELSKAVYTALKKRPGKEASDARSDH